MKGFVVKCKAKDLQVEVIKAWLKAEKERRGK